MEAKIKLLLIGIVARAQTLDELRQAIVEIITIL